MASRYRRDGDHRRKIRESCNSCSSQKIRCGKQRPSCARCVAKGLECNYSYSQRTGRRAPTRMTRSDSLSIAPIAAPATPVASESGSLIGVRSTSMTPMPPVMMHNGGDAFSLGSAQDATTTTTFDDTEDVFQDFNSGISLDFLCSPATESSTSCNTFVNSVGTAGPVQTVSPLTPYSQPSNKWQSWQTNISTSAPGTFTPPTNGDLMQDQRATSTTQASQPYHHGQDCMTLAMQVIRDLHVSREHCTTAASDPMTCMQALKDDPRDVDAVLFLNRDAIKSVNKILACPCSADPIVSLACYLAATKIVEWYGAAVGITIDGSQGANTGNNSDNLPDEEVHLRPISDRIIERPIFMGRYCLDAEVHRSVRAKVVLNELREHVQPLMGRLPRYQVSHSNIRGSKHGTFLHSSFSKDNDGQPCALRNQVRRIIREASNINKHM